MLFNMALSTAELTALNSDVRRLLAPGGCTCTQCGTSATPPTGTGTSHGDDMFENGGFIVHFFDRALVGRLAAGFTLLDLTAFEEGSLPRRLWRVTLRETNDQDTS